MLSWFYTILKFAIGIALVNAGVRAGLDDQVPAGDISMAVIMCVGMLILVWAVWSLNG